jgi:hypothetical protein
VGFTSGTADAGEDAVRLCSVPETGVRIRNLGPATVYVGGPDVTPETGFPLDPAPAPAQLIEGAAARETPVVPAPPDDMADAALYGCTAAGAGAVRVAWISVSLT